MGGPAKFASHREARAAGWFSRRHETDAAHREAQQRWRDEQTAKAEREQVQINSKLDLGTK